MNELIVNISYLEKIYSDFLLARTSLRPSVRWALDNLDVLDDESAILLASATDEDEVLSLTRSIISKYGNLSQLEPDVSVLVSKIHTAFSTTPIPLEITIYHYNDSEDYDGEGKSVEEYFAKKEWSDIDLSGHGGYLLRYLTPEAAAYYLPSFLEFSLLNNLSTTDFTDSLFHWIGPQDSHGLSRINEVLSKLTKHQCEVVLSVLRYVSNRDQCYQESCLVIKDIFDGINQPGKAQ